ncbi:MAG: type II toxin-antitoxin system VapC family toxin [Halobacteriota archaeon]
MNEMIFDANFLVALVDERDVWHSKAVTLLNALRIKETKAVYLDCVLNEVISVVGRRFEEKGRTNEFDGVLRKIKKKIPEGSITWVYPRVPELYKAILNLVGEHKGKLNFHDALIALVSKEMRTKYIVSFDKDFNEIVWLKRINKETIE